MKRTLSKPTPVRLHTKTGPELSAIARRFGLKPADLIRLAVDQKLQEWARTGVVTIEYKG